MRPHPPHLLLRTQPFFTGVVLAVIGLNDDIADLGSQTQFSFSAMNQPMAPQGEKATRSPGPVLEISVAGAVASIPAPRPALPLLSQQANGTFSFRYSWS